MPRIIDLTLPVEEHFRWAVERRLTADLAKGDGFQVTWLGLPVHAFTHIVDHARTPIAVSRLFEVRAVTTAAPEVRRVNGIAHFIEQVPACVE